MPTIITHWSWVEAFDKFGFDDGNGPVMTDEVVEALRTAGYDASAESWGSHNIVIGSIKHLGVDQIPAGTNIGYDDPRSYLPKAIIDLLDAALPDTADTQVQP